MLASEARAYRICLIVDNPLRDIDGLIWVAWNLAQHGHTVYLTPMYEQGFDVLALMPDIVVANYARPNNIELLRRFHNAGIAVAILDTEGSPGRDMEKFARMVGQTGIGEFAALYCIWGQEQFEAFIAQGSVPQNILFITGCPRYDYCVAPLRQSLLAPEVSSDYVLINTNFPIANPRFTRSVEDERKTMISVGYDESFADKYVKDVMLAHKQIKNVVRQLVEAFPDVFFVLRPHPFEDSGAYIDAIRLPNFEVRQEGTSIEWLNHAKLLIHLNCLTAIESMMLDVESVSVEWINTPTLALQGPPLNVSHQMQVMDELLQTVEHVLKGGTLTLNDEIEHARSVIIGARYHANDGASAIRIVAAIEALFRVKSDAKAKLNRVDVGFSLKQLMRQFLGYNLFHVVRKMSERSTSDARRQVKQFTFDEVAQKLARINHAYPAYHPVTVETPCEDDIHLPRMFSGHTLKIWRN
jgi:surface carbohydrate biosynthesis protein